MKALGRDRYVHLYNSQTTMQFSLEITMTRKFHLTRRAQSDWHTQVTSQNTDDDATAAKVPGFLAISASAVSNLFAAGQPLPHPAATPPNLHNPCKHKAQQEGMGLKNRNVLIREVIPLCSATYL